MKSIKKMLAEGADKVLPDKKVKENIRSGLGIREEEAQAAYAHGGSEGIKKTRTPLIAAAAALIAAVIILSILLPVFFGKKNALSPSLNNKFEQITDADSFYAYGAASVGSLLAAEAEGAGGSIAAKNFTGGSIAAKNFARPAETGALRAGSAKTCALRALSVKALPVSSAETENAAASPSQQAQIDTVNRYLSLVEGLLGEGGISETPAAGNDKYPYGRHISYLDLLGETVRYTLYYDKIFRGGDKDEEESEAYYSIEGELIVEGRAYPVEGNYTAESETDKDESEESGTLEFTAYTGENSYIRAVQETERETEEDESGIEVYYVYTVVEEGKVIERTEVEYEKEDEEDESELELALTIEKGGRRERLTFTDETEDGRRVLRARGNIGGDEVRFSVYILKGKYHYVFEDGSSSDSGRFDDDDDDDDDD